MRSLVSLETAQSFLNAALEAKKQPSFGTAIGNKVSSEAEAGLRLSQRLPENSAERQWFIRSDRMERKEATPQRRHDQPRALLEQPELELRTNSFRQTPRPLTTRPIGHRVAFLGPAAFDLWSERDQVQLAQAASDGRLQALPVEPLTEKDSGLSEAGDGHPSRGIASRPQRGHQQDG